MNQILSSSNIKRQILAESDITGIRKRLQEKMTGDQEGTFLEIGDALESLVQHKGWTFLEAYMMKSIKEKLLNPDEPNPYTQGFINLMHYIDGMIRVKNDILEKRKNEAG